MIMSCRCPSFAGAAVERPLVVFERVRYSGRYLARVPNGDAAADDELQPAGSNYKNRATISDRSALINHGPAAAFLIRLQSRVAIESCQATKRYKLISSDNQRAAE